MTPNPNAIIEIDTTTAIIENNDSIASTTSSDMLLEVSTSPAPSDMVTDTEVTTTSTESDVFPEGTEVTTINKGSYVGKIKKVKKVNKNVKYQIEWFGESSPSIPSSGKNWYDSTLVQKLKKRVVKQAKRFSLDTNVTCLGSLVSEEEKVRVFEEAKHAILKMPCEYPIDKLNEALEEEGYPYGLQGVMNRLLEKVGLLETKFPEWNSGKLKPLKVKAANKVDDSGDHADLTGKIIRRTFHGIEHEGVVMHKHDDEHLWHVKYDDGDEEDLDGFEVMRLMHPRRMNMQCLGRRLHSLELFAGTCIVSDAFYYREWDVESTDILRSSMATLKADILHLDPHTDFTQVPDFIWASPPCETYSNLSGGTHRCIRDNELDRSENARKHNYIFMKMVEIMVWAKIRHPHLIVVIENPLGKLPHMPLMKEFERHFDLTPVQVHYCTFGRDERKATLLWTNYPHLRHHLEDFKCGIHRCSVGGKHLGVRTNTKDYDFSSIPENLAREVARVVDAKFTLDRVHRYEAACPRSDIGKNSSLLEEEIKARDCYYPLTTIPDDSAVLEVEIE